MEASRARAEQAMRAQREQEEKARREQEFLKRKQNYEEEMKHLAASIETTKAGSIDLRDRILRQKAETEKVATKAELGEVDQLLSMVEKQVSKTKKKRQKKGNALPPFFRSSLIISSFFLLFYLAPKMVDELNSKQDELPQAQPNETQTQTWDRELAEKRWEHEVAIMQQQLAQARLKELTSLQETAEARRRAEKAMREKNTRRERKTE